MSNDEMQLRTAMFETCRRIADLGLSLGTSGNLSARLGASELLVTPSGIAWDEITALELAVVDATDRYRGPRQPTTEWRLHRAVMRERPDVGAVVHTHSLNATAVACLRRDLPALHYSIVVAGGGSTIPCAAYATFGSEELAQHAVAALAGRDACLLANHGVLAVGKTLASALRRARDVEHLAQLYVVAAGLGEPVILPEDEMERVRRKFFAYGTASSVDADLVRIDD